ncbi:hypothetical protein [Streptomyces sp. NPDC056600]|uniref:hypothetical protein n=1 Tax=Streptomyces sp. NPDC056600 TaxID=3345874 RepID=UPI00368D5AB5
MNQNCKAAMAAAVAGGYLLGRTKKAKLALAVGTYLAGRRFSMSPTQLATQGLTKLRETPQFQDLTDQMRHEVLNAGRAAVTAAARRKLLDLSDSLRDRGERLSGVADDREDDDDADDRRDADDAYDAYDDEDEAYDEGPSGEDRDEDVDDEDEDREEDDAPAAGRGRPRRTSAGSAGLRNSAADRGSARRATVRRAASTGPAVANAAVKKKTAARSGSASGSGSRRGK